VVNAGLQTADAHDVVIDLDPRGLLVRLRHRRFDVIVYGGMNELSCIIVMLFWCGMSTRGAQ